MAVKPKLETQKTYKGWFLRLLDRFFPNLSTRRNEAIGSIEKESEERSIEPDVIEQLEINKNDANMTNLNPNGTLPQRREKTIYEIGMFYGLTDSEDAKEQYAGKIKSILEDSVEDAKRVEGDVRQHFEQLTKTAKDTKKALKESLGDLSEYQKSSVDYFRKIFTSTEMLSVDDKRRGELAEKLVDSYVKSLDKMKADIDRHLDQIENMVNSIDELAIRSTILKRYNDTLNTLEKTDQQLNELEKGFASGQALKRNLDS
jgi:wyosine [tRNA(Phe)-imidazoG37] synthetase (radical SAM superfamily)